MIPIQRNARPGDQSLGGFSAKEADNTIQARWRIRFYGQVQHVGFRYTAFYLARKLELTGWVKNLADGSVLMEAQGQTAQLRKLLMQLKSQLHLHITHTDISVLSIQKEEKGFAVKSAG